MYMGHDELPLAVKAEVNVHLHTKYRRLFAVVFHSYYRSSGNAMQPFASYILRKYYEATGWNEDNLYSNLTRSSNG